MNLVELDRALRQLHLSGMAAVLETRLRQAQMEKVTPIDLVSMLVSDELLRRHRHERRAVGDEIDALDVASDRERDGADQLLAVARVQQPAGARIPDVERSGE